MATEIVSLDGTWKVGTGRRCEGGITEPGLYGIRHDPAACQLVLNMLANALEPERGEM